MVTRRVAEKRRGIADAHASSCSAAHMPGKRPGLTSKKPCVTMLDMKTATIRQIQHHLSEVLRWVEDGQEVQIARRKRVIAKIVPARDDQQSVVWPDFIGRSTKIWGKSIRGKSVSRIIIEDRKERVGPPISTQAP